MTYGLPHNYDEQRATSVCFDLIFGCETFLGGISVLFEHLILIKCLLFFGSISMKTYQTRSNTDAKLLNTKMAIHSGLLVPTL